MRINGKSPIYCQLIIHINRHSRLCDHYYFMAHRHPMSRRAQLRQAFIAQLLNATVAEERVYSGRIMPIDDEEEGPALPAIVVHTRHPMNDTPGPVTYSRLQPVLIPKQP